MERYIMFLDWKNQYCQKTIHKVKKKKEKTDYTTWGNLLTQSNISQITNGIICRYRQKNP